MRRIIKKTFQDLVIENKIALLNNEEELEKIELRLEEKYTKLY